MASTELLASKIVILEEEPAIPAVPALPSAVLLAIGLSERGPFADRTLTTAWEEYARTFGGFTTWSDLAVAVYGFFYQGGSFAWISRTCHFTDLMDPSTYTATVGARMLSTSGTGSTPAVVVGSVAGPWNLNNWGGVDHEYLYVEVDGAPGVEVHFQGKQAHHASGAVYPLAVALVAGEALNVKLNNGVEQVVIAACGESTEIDVANLINSQIAGGACMGSLGSPPDLYSDRFGTTSAVEITGGTANAKLLFPAGINYGTGNVADRSLVTPLEAEAIIEAALPGAVDGLPRPGNLFDLATTALGPTHSIQITAGTSTAAAVMGLDTSLHTGAASLPEPTLNVVGKTPGSYTGAITIKIEAATNGEAARFNLKVLVNGAVRETFPNITMLIGDPDYAQTRVNHATYGSDLVQVTDQLLPYSPTLKRPANGTSAALAGGGDGLVGLADSDFLGNDAGPTGLYVFDTVQTGRILIIPGRATPAIHQGMIDYAEGWRNGSMFCILDPPAQYSAQQMVTYVETTASLLERSEFAAIYWPRIKVTNPQPSVFGTGDTITIAPSGWIAGKYAANDQKLGGVYESPAGVGGGFGIIRGLMGVEDDPAGSSTHPVEKERVRDLIYPKRINPITRLPGLPWHIDGGRTLKSQGNFPNIGERRGVIFIEQAVASAMVYFKHRFNNRENRKRAERMIRAFLIREMGKGAFRSTNPAEAFFVDVSDQLNPTAAVFAGVMTIRIGLATNKPAEFIVILVTQDTRGMEESLAAA
jgi:phage tail sheath protein FI